MDSFIPYAAKEFGPYRQRRRSASDERPYISNLRIVLLGKNISENSRVRNLILGIDVCETEEPTALEEYNVTKVGGMVKDRHVTVINTLHLLNLNLSDHQITQTVRECVNQSDPGPHAFIIMLQYNDFTEEDIRRVKHVLKKFSEDAIKRTIVITTDKETYRSKFSSMFSHSEQLIVGNALLPAIHQLIKECGGGHLQLDERKSEVQSDIFKRVEKILKEIKEDYLTCDIFHDVIGTSVDEEQLSSEEENRSSHNNDDGKPKERRKRRSDEGSLFSNIRKKNPDIQLNLVLCGSNPTFKVSVSKLLRGKKIKPPDQKASSDECVKKEEKIYGRQISVVELPALSQLSEEEVMHQTLNCVSLCGPGVHVFIIIIPVAPLTDEDKAEIEKIQKTFYSKQHFMLLFTSDLSLEGVVLDFVKSSTESQRLISRCGGQYSVMGLHKSENSRQIQELLDCIEKMKTEPYSLQMYVKAQENRVRHELEEKLSEMENKIKDLEKKFHLEEEVRNTNQGRYFTNSMFEDAEMSIKKRMEEILKEREREIQAQNKALKAKYELEKKNLMTRLEEEKQRLDEERIKMANQFKEKEEKLKKEYEEKKKTEQKKQETEKQKQSEEEKQRRAEYLQKIEEMKRESENQKSQYEKQQKEREEEERKREEKYRRDQEKMKNDQERIIAELHLKQEEETKKRDLEEKRRNEEEEEERQRWKRKIKEAENDKKEIQEEIKRQQREWEDEKKRQMREREEEERKRKEKHEEQLREKQEELEKMRKKFKREREKERQKIEEEREKQRREREEKEREYRDKKTELERHYERLERERKEEWERRKREDDERQEELIKRWKKKEDDLKQEKEEEMKRREKAEKERKEGEEKERDEVKKEYEEKIKVIKKKHEEAARKQAEELNDFRERKEQHIQELQQMLEERQKQQELLERLYKHLQEQKGAEVKELQQEVEKLKAKTSGCVIL
ncbi:hypothetical protein Q8A67_001294 [Cirrhinus molitorella]|uniref:AIG1-type G domain-containing protein n=1 Tax=Cirrhinus molitorella TaxID=172907 RepID=A0AA88QHD7_9TELE|nr:hypothetical protein Q8A67_001294 [Cirrhinus molitorella]